MHLNKYNYCHHLCPVFKPPFEFCTNLALCTDSTLVTLQYKIPQVDLNTK